MTEIHIHRPADMHVHFREDDLLAVTVPLTGRRFATALAMPNLSTPLVTAQAAINYHNQLRNTDAHDKRTSETPATRFLCSLYLSPQLQVKELVGMIERDRWNRERRFAGVKYYPPGLTTNSDAGIADPLDLWTPGRHAHDLLMLLGGTSHVLMLHAADGLDKNGRELDPFDQERHFLTESLPRIIEAHPLLRISIEHVSTAWGADVMRRYRDNPLIGCSLTAHHLLLDRRDMLRGGMRPHRFWWPILQSSEHRDELCMLAFSDHPRVWLGSDSAPHAVGKKENACCAGGVLTAHAGIELYAEAFDGRDLRLDHAHNVRRFEQFASVNGPKFYGLPISGDTIRLSRRPWTVRTCYGSDQDIIPFRSGEQVAWTLMDQEH